MPGPRKFDETRVWLRLQEPDRGGERTHDAFRAGRRRVANSCGRDCRQAVPRRRDRLPPSPLVSRTEPRGSPRPARRR
jgi:hypothetical protein